MAFTTRSRSVSVHPLRDHVGSRKELFRGDRMSRSPALVPSRWGAGLQELFENTNILSAQCVTSALSPRG